ncbi:MAG: hypothetical protein HDR16_06150 [Lachnospiraceae bacterium]|nr:hypothetical protein [Lachnospiraceae bacterium]
MKRRGKAGKKRILAFLLSISMMLGGFITNVMPVLAAPIFYASERDLNSNQGCHICSVAMVLTAMGKTNATPSAVLKNNQNQYGIVWENIHKSYGVQTTLGYFSGSSENRKSQLYSLCQQYPYGIDVYAPYPVLDKNNNIIMQDHFIYAFIENGTLYIHNPGYYNWSSRIVGKNATHYDDYSSFTSYRIFTDKSGGTVTPTPTPQPTSDPITFQSVTYSNVTATTAYVEANVTADSSQLSEVGMRWGKIVNGICYTQTDFSWPGSSVRSKISVDFGKEKDKAGNIPSLSPGNTYKCQFFAVTKAGKEITTKELFFTTLSATSTDTTPPAISNVRVELYRVNLNNMGYCVECDVYDNVGVTKVAFPTWTVKNGQDDLQTPWATGSFVKKNADGSSTYRYYVNVADHNYEEGYYATHIYAYDAAGNNSMVAVSPDTYIDRTAPTISDIKITDQTDTGYTVQCRVTDNVGVSRVKFPTWTEKNGQDDIIWGEGTKNGDIYSYRVNISDHNNEYGIYHTHIYSYDAMGNERSAAAPDYNMAAITIAKQPESLIGASGETVVFRISAVGTNLRYRWQYKPFDFNEWFDCDFRGEQLPELRFTIKGKSDDQMDFRCIVTNDSGHTVISQTARLSVLNNVKKYTVTFDSQGGTYVGAIKNIVENTKIASLPNPPSRNYFTFRGWYTQPNGQGRIFDENTIINGDMTVYAYWTLQSASIPNGFWVNDVPAQQYIGKAIKPYIEVYDGERLLKEKADYTLTYKNNIKANDASDAKTAPTVMVKGKGNYSGTETVLFPILKKNINDDDVIIDNITKAYNSKVQKPVPTVTWNGKKLKNKTDFIVNYLNTDENAYMAVGTYQIEIIGKGNYSGRRLIKLTITNRRLMSKVSVTKIPNQLYTGDEIEPMLVVKDGRTLLTEGVDYTVSYQNNIETGTAKAVLTGIWDYCGEKSVSFKIIGIDIKKASVTNIPKSVMYTGDSITVNPSLEIIGDEGVISLQENQDYTVNYQKNKAVGTATVIFKGINNYSGTLKKTFRITPYNIAEDINNQIQMDGGITTVYMAGGSKPGTTVYFGEQILVEGRDYTIKYGNNQIISTLAAPDKLPVMNVCGKGNFTGSQKMNYRIVPQSIESLTIETQDKVYKNAAGNYKSIPKITDWNGKTLKAGRDYESDITYTYAENTILPDGVVRIAGSLIEPTDILPSGTKIIVTVTGKGNYTGVISDMYRITQQDIRKAKVKVLNQIYTGDELYPGKEQIEIKVGKTILADTDYEIVGYKNNVKKGTATVILHGTGDYGGTKKATFKIVAKGFKWWWR